MAVERELRLLVTMKDNASRGLGAIGGALSNVGKIAGGAMVAGIGAGAVAVGGFLATAFAEATEAEAGMAQLEAVIRSTGGAAGMTADEVLALSSSLSAANGLSKFSDDAVLAANNLLLTFTNIGENVFPQASQAAVDMAQALGTDPVAQATALGKALNDPIAGIAALSRVGVTFTEDQKNVIAAMVETGDVAGAQQIILAELNKEFGGSAAAAADTFSGRMMTLREQFNGVAEGLGTRLLPGLLRLMEVFTGDGGAGLQQFADTLGNVLATGLEWAANAVETFKQAMAGDWVDSDVIDPFSRVAGVVGQMVAAFTGEGGLAGAIDIALPYIQEGFSALTGWITDTALPALIEAVKAWAPPFLEWVITDVIPFIGEKLGALLLAIGTWIAETAIPALVELVKTFGPPFLDWIENEVLPMLGDKLNLIYDNIVAWVDENLQRISDSVMAIGRGIVDGVAAGIRAAPGAVFDALKGIIDAAIADILLSFGIESPSKVTRDLIGIPLVEGIAAGILMRAATLRQQLRGFVQESVGELSGLLGFIEGSGGRTWPGSGDKFDPGRREQGGGGKMPILPIGGYTPFAGGNTNNVVINISGANRHEARQGTLEALRAAGIQVVG